MQQFADQVLATDDIEHRRDRHQNDTQHHSPDIDIGGTEKGEQQCKGDIDQYAEHKGRQGDSQAGPHTLFDIETDITTVIRAAKIEDKQTNGFSVENGIGDRFQPFCLSVV